MHSVALRLKAVVLIGFTLYCAHASAAVSTTILWNNTSGGNWNNPGNWSPAQVPGAADVAVINLPGTYIVTLDVDTTVTSLCVGGPSGQQTLAISTNMLTLSSGSIVDVNGAIALSGTSALTVNEILTVSGALNWSGGTINGNGALTIKGAMNIQSGTAKTLDTLNVNNYGTITWSGDTPAADMSWTNFASVLNFNLFDITGNAMWTSDGNSAITDLGVFRKSAGTGTTTIDHVNFGNQLNGLPDGTLEVDSGTLYFDQAAEFVPLSGGTLSHGSFVVKAILQVQSASITTLGNTTLTLDGAAARIQDETSNDALGALTSVNPGASLIVQNGATVTAGSTFANSGAVSVIGPTSVFSVTSGNYDQSGGTTTIHNGGTIAANGGSIDNNSGVIMGDGTLNTSLVNNGTGSTSGTISPGFAPSTTGAITITGTLSNDSTFGVISMKAAGTGAGQFDQLNIGASTITGVLLVDAVGGYKPNNGDLLTIINGSGAISGNFATTNFLGAAGTTFGQGTTGNNLQLAFNSSITKTWNGTTSNVWGTASNWTPNGVPGSGDNVRIPAAIVTTPVLDNSGYSVNDLLVDSAAGTRLDLVSFSLTVGGNLQTAGAIIASSGGFLTLAGFDHSVESLGANGALPTTSVTGSVTVTNASVTTFNGLVDVPGQLSINASATTINGNFSTSSSGQLTMTQAADNLTVTGDATFNGGTGQLTNGLLSIGGNLNAGASKNQFVAAAPHTTRLTGASSGINVPAAQSDVFGNLAIGAAATPANVQLQSDVVVAGNVNIVAGTVTSAMPALIATLGGSLIDPAGGNWQAANTTFTGSPQMPPALASTVTFTGHAVLAQGFTILGANDLLIGTGGELDIGGNLVVVGRDFHTNPGGILDMFNQAGELSTLNDVYFGGVAENGSLLAGRIRDKGDFQSGNTNVFTGECVHIVTLDGATPQIVTINTPAMEPFQNLEINGASTSVTFMTNAMVSGTFNLIAGSVTVADTFTLTVFEDYIQAAGNTLLPGLNSHIAVFAPKSVQVLGGNLSGIGTIQGNLLNAGQVSPGLAGAGNEGALTVQGAYTQSPTGALNVRVNSTSTFDKLSAFSGATLAGTLNITLDGYAGNLGDTFTIVNGSESLAGTFAAVNGGSISTTLGFAANYLAVTAQLVVQQKPAITSVLTATGQVGAAFTPYTITATGSPTITLASGPVPTGLTVNAAGVISGTPLPGAEGVSNVTLTATNSVGVDTQTLVLTINRVPAFTSPPTVAGVIGQPFMFTLSAAGFPVPVFAASSALPPGLTLTGNVISGTPTATGVTPVMLTAQNSIGTDMQTLSISIGTSGPPVLVSVTTSQTPQLTGTNVTFTAIATQPDNAPLTFTWDFGDGSATVTGDPVQYAYATEGTFTVTVTVTDGITPVQGTVAQQTLAPSSGAMNVPNIGQNDPPVMNPLNGISIGVTSSNGGVITFGIDINALIRDAFTVSTDFTDVGGRGGAVSGLTVVHKFLQSGVDVVTSTATNATTLSLAGKARKTMVISDQEVGAPPKFKNPPKKSTINITTLKGNFAFGSTTTLSSAGTSAEPFAAAAKPDLVSMAGSIELPEGLDLTQPQTFSFGIGNIIDQVTVSSKGKAQLPSTLKRVKSLQIRYPPLPKGSKLTTAGQIAKFTITISQAGLSPNGFDTEGISATLKTGESRKKPTSRSIQVAFSFAGSVWEVKSAVLFTLATNGASGSMSGRGGQ